MKVVVMGCGRVGARISSILAASGSQGTEILELPMPFTSVMTAL